MSRSIMIVLDIVFGMALLAVLFVALKPGVIGLADDVSHEAHCIVVKTTNYMDEEGNGDSQCSDNGESKSSNSINHTDNNHADTDNGGNNSNSSNNSNSDNNNPNNSNRNSSNSNQNNSNHKNSAKSNSSNNKKKKKNIIKSNIFIHYIYNHHQVGNVKDLYKAVGTNFNAYSYMEGSNVPKGYKANYCVVSNGDGRKFTDISQNVFVNLEKIPKHE